MGQQAQSIGNVETVTDLPDIQAEQAAAAASTGGEGTFKPVYEEDEPSIASIKPPVEPVEVVKTEAAPTIRVLDDLDEDLRPLFKQMSNDAHNKLKPLVQEHKKFKAEVETLKQQLETNKKAGLPESYLEHEFSYVLSPEFTSASQDANVAESVLQHYRTQLANVRNGDDTYVPLTKNERGEIITGTPVKIDRTTETMLAEYHQWAHSQYTQAQAKADAIATGHKTNAAQVKQWLGGFEQQAFPTFDKDAGLQTLVTDTVSKFPPALRGSPLTRLLAKAFIVMGQQHEALEKVKKPASSAAPSAAAIAGGGSGKSVAASDETIGDLFEKAKRGEL